jgi:hypothetical protein
VKAVVHAVTLASLAVLAGCSDQNAPAPARADAAAASGFTIVRLDPSLDSIVSPDATLDTIGDRFGLTEGRLAGP